MSLSKNELKESLDLFEFAPGHRASWKSLRMMLPDITTALFFGKVYDLDRASLETLLSKLFKTDVISALFEQSSIHSTELQGYLEDLYGHEFIRMGRRPDFIQGTPRGVLLPEVWASLEVEVTKTIKDVAKRLGNILAQMPGKKGTMTFEHLARMNRRRPTIGDFSATISHRQDKRTLIILDVSGSMTESTISTIVDDVVALSLTADAHMAIVSNDTHYWEPGTFNVRDILREATYGGTNYLSLEPLLNEDWGTVVTIADYDSYTNASDYLASNCTGTIGKVLDLSLVDRPTYLAECVGRLAEEVSPLLIGTKRNLW